MTRSFDVALKAAVFSGSRSEYGLMRHLIQKLNECPAIELQLIVSGSHLSTKYGSTISEILADGITPTAQVKLSLDGSSDVRMDFLCSEAIAGLSHHLRVLRPEIIFILGDRYETFAAAISAHLNSIPIVHLHGGESTHGALDDKLRHAISQLSTWHFTAAEQYRQRVIAMGHDSDSVHNIGPMVADSLINFTSISRSEFEEITGYSFGSKNLLVTFHPETTLADNGIDCFKSFLAALELIPCNVLFTHPNADEGSNELLALVQNYVQLHPHQAFDIASLGHDLYLGALSLFEAVAGNSSSAVIEAPLIGIPSLNIGERQSGRLQYPSVVNSPCSLPIIHENLKKVLASGVLSAWPRVLNENVVVSPSQSIMNWLEIQFHLA